MNPIYKFELSANSVTIESHPNFKDDLAIEYALESNQEFYRGKLNGKLTFQKEDFSFIIFDPSDGTRRPLDTQFDIVIYISYDRGSSWSQYWAGQFWRTDCEVDEDDKTVIASPNVNDQYNAILAGLEKEFDLISLAPVIQPIKLDKRSLIQVYVPGQSVIGCFLSNMWWEQECEAISNVDDLINTYHFQKNVENRNIVCSGNISPQLPPAFTGPKPYMTPNYSYYLDNGDFRIYVGCSENDINDYELIWYVYQFSTQKTLWYRDIEHSNMPEQPDYSIELEPQPGTGATGTLTLTFSNMSVYARRISDITTNTYPIPYNDIVANNRNYRRVCGVDISDQLIISSKLTSTPTEWGIYQPGQYYVMPYNATFGPKRCYPIARSMWTQISLWFAVSQTDWQVEPAWRTEFTLEDAYPIYSVISVLLNQIAPGITHEGTTDYSQFLYGGQPLQIPNQRVFLTQKSNLVTAGYDQPAQKAPITLKAVFDMLRDCFRCYWFIDSTSKLRIEHIEYFRRGGSYDSTPVVGINLNTQLVTRNGKPWSFATKKYSFDKPELAAWYQFGWMDNSTELFDGLPLKMISKYVNQDKIETIELTQFTSDVDYMMLNPSDISVDGFALLAPIISGSGFKLPYFTFTIDSVDYILQNAYAAFAYLQMHYRWDMPAKKYLRNGSEETARGTKMLMIQTVNFPMVHDLNLTNLVQTSLGKGSIQKLTVTLLSRNAKATLRYEVD